MSRRKLINTYALTKRIRNMQVVTMQNVLNIIYSMPEYVLIDKETKRAINNAITLLMIKLLNTPENMARTKISLRNQINCLRALIGDENETVEKNND